MPDKPSFELERHIVGIVAGIDEVGRGPWAGPVVTAAVIIDPALYDSPLFSHINDSKKLSAKRRDTLYEQLLSTPGIHFALGEASVQEIDNINILQATFLAMTRAVEALPIKPDFALVDGNRAPPLSCPSKPIIKGDQISISIAAASIIAKVTRDRLMADLGQTYPSYGWGNNAGYGTADHQRALREFGVTPHHRRSFAPIAAILDSIAA